MTPELCLITVPHSGTRFTTRLFTERRPKWDEWDLVAQKRNPDRSNIYVGHCTKETQTKTALERSKRMPLITALRHPFRVEESWRRREIGKYNDLLEAYANLMKLIPHISSFLPIDAKLEVKQAALAQMSKVAGLELEADWSHVVNSLANTTFMSMEQFTPSQPIIEIALHPIFQTYYGQADV